MTPIYCVWGRGLGDVWSSISALINVALIEKQVLKLSLYYFKGTKRRDISCKIKECLPLFERANMIELTEERETESKYSLRKYGMLPVAKTSNKWNPTENIICYQFDGKSHGCKNLPDKSSEERILNYIQSKGFAHIKLGGHISIKESVDYLAKCKCFIGVESGFGHISGSVGTKMFMIRNGLPQKDFNILLEGRECVKCDDEKDLYNKFELEGITNVT